jgi:hypothetical protein
VVSYKKKQLYLRRYLVKKSMIILRPDLGCYLKDRPNLRAEKSEGKFRKRIITERSLEKEQSAFFGGNTVIPPIGYMKKRR